MRIISFEFDAGFGGWQLERIPFNTDLTLLVGASGAGKTLILRSLTDLPEVAKGVSYPEMSWRFEFESDEGCLYCWEGKIASEAKVFLGRIEGIEEDECSFQQEKLTLDGNLVAERDQCGGRLDGKELPKLPLEESFLHTLRAEDTIRPVRSLLQKLVFRNYRAAVNKTPFPSRKEADYHYEHYGLTSLEKLREISLPFIEKLYLLEKLAAMDRPAWRMFQRLRDRFTGIFPCVEAVRAAIAFDAFDLWTAHSPDDDLFLQIKERGVNNWISQKSVSSGMLKVLIQLCDLYLSPRGSVFLLDEFENSLGINCINEITEDIMASEFPFQFIMTSHHPCIINSIPSNRWRLVTRNGGAVKTQSLSELGEDFSLSHHDQFMQLLQLEEYKTGRAQERVR